MNIILQFIVKIRITFKFTKSLIKRDFETAIKREMMEEFGVEVTVGQHITSTTFYHKEKECFLDAFEVHFAHDGIQNPFVLTEHTEYRWENIENIPNLFFVDSDLAIYDDVKKWCTK